MIAINVISKNEFMNAIFIKDTFDYMLVSELELTTINTFSVDGRINKDFIKKNDLKSLKTISSHGEYQTYMF